MKEKKMKEKKMKEDPSYTGWGIDSWFNKIMRMQ